MRCATSRFGWSARRSRRATGAVESWVTARFDQRESGGRLAPSRAADRGTAEEARACFSDGFPILLANQTSLDALNALLKAKNVAPVPMNRFRPNVVVGEAIGGGRVDAWAEDAWGRVTLTGKDARRAGVGLDLVKPCSRCGGHGEPGEPALEAAGPNARAAGDAERGTLGVECGFDDEDWKETPFFAWNAVSDPARLGERRRGRPRGRRPAEDVQKRHEAYRVRVSYRVRVDV